MGDPSVDALLTPHALSGSEREQLLDHVLDRVSPIRERFQRRRFAFVAIGIAACAAALGLTLNPSAGKDGAFRSRGSTEGVRVELVCSGGTLAACPRGSHLLFVESTGGGSGYLAAYAEPTGGGERIWYFSGEGQSPAITPAVGLKPLDIAIEVGPEHRPGHYSVHVVLAARPLSRAEILRGDTGPILASQTTEFEVVP